jgi:hypothetical protein
LLIRHSHGCELAIDGARHATHAASWSSSSGESDIGSTSGIVRLQINYGRLQFCTLAKRPGQSNTTIPEVSECGPAHAVDLPLRHHQPSLGSIG